MSRPSEQIAQLRREYISHPLDVESVDQDPILQFKSWFDEAVEVYQPDPEAMTLSTSSRDGRVSARIVLLKVVDSRGFGFFTNYQSRKSQELIDNPYAALTFYWSLLNRQVNVAGAVEKVTEQESGDYFRTRPRGSQLGAWASPQSRELAGRDLLERLMAEVEERFGDRAVPCPPFWGGFRVKPVRIEFWQGRESRLHDRIQYSLQEGAWRISRLAP